MDTMGQDPIYYRLYRDTDGQPTVVCLQSFDEPHYDAARFVNTRRYLTEEQARRSLHMLTRPTWPHVHFTCPTCNAVVTPASTCVECGQQISGVRVEFGVDWRDQ